MSETMYIKKLVGIVSDNGSYNKSNMSSNVDDMLEDTTFSDPDNEVNPNTRTKLQYDMDINGAAYKTDLGSVITKRTKLTLKDLGTHMSERMLKSMSQDNINLVDPVYLNGWVGDGSSTAENILKKFSSTIDTGNWYDSSSGSNAAELLANIQERYGDYVSVIEDWQKYGESSPGLGMGEANVLNPSFQFNEIDDIRSDVRRPKIGRMYSEEIYDYNMPIVYFQPGTVSINTSGIKLASAFVNKQTLKYQDYLRGSGNPIEWGMMKFGNLMQSIVSFGAKYILNTATWYKWTPNVFKYMRFVNEILLELASWMGLLDGTYTDGSTSNDYHDYETAQNKTSDGDSLSKMISDTAENKDSNIFEERKGLDEDSDAFNGVGYETRKGYMGGTNKDGVLSVLRVLPQFKKKKNTGNIGTDDETVIDNGWPLAMLTIPFAIDKGASSSEAFSNSTMEHPIRQQYNDAYEQSNNARMTDILGNPVDNLGSSFVDAAENVATGNIGSWFAEKGSAIWSSVKQAASDGAQNTLAGLGWSSEAGMVAAGLGRFLLPEVWSDSSFDKSYSISMKLRSPYGHRLSIYENDFVPLSFLIGLTSPRKIGIQSYTNPFYVRVYSKGLFSIPMGMISSLNITRGEDTNDRTVEGFFRTVSVQLSIKDVMPNVAMSLDGGIFSLSKATNMGMENYLCTLAGIDFIERASMVEIFKNNWSKIKNLVRSFNLFGDYGATNRSNMWMLISRGTVPGKFISRQATKLGLSSNPFATRTPTEYY